MLGKIIIWILLFIGFLLLFRQIHWVERIRRLLKQSRESMDEAARQRMLQSRKTLLSVEKEQSLWIYVERELQYSGLKQKLPFLTAENWIVGNVVFFAAVLSILLMMVPKWWMALSGITIVAGVEVVFFTVAKIQAMRSIDQNLLKFLDFLGNYSITAGEVTGIFDQVSKYVEEPLKSALNECYYEAQTTGDASLALLTMAEKIEHPQFKELMRNMEISVRYCADFTALVQSSRRTVREYLRMGGERKAMLREAAINMALLLAMSGFVLLTVDGLVDASVWEILRCTWPGRLAVGGLGIILLLFARQIYKINR